MSRPVETAFCVFFIALICVGILSARTLQEACGPLPDVAYAIKPQGQASFTAEGQQLEYSCKAGYQRQGNRFIRCSNNQWEWVDLNRPFSCRIVRCPPPPRVSHGSYPGHNYTFGNVLTMRCNDGYRVKANGLDHIICQPNRRWTVISAWCEEVKCRPLAAPQHGSMTLVRGSDSLVFGTTYSFECDREHMLRGFQAREKMERKCRSDGTWDNVEAECIEIQCPVLDHLENGQIDANDNLFGAIATFDCNGGYDMIPPYSDDSKVAYCQRDGRWSVTIPQCKPNHCGALPPQAHAVFDSGTWFPIGRELNYGCDAGYTYRGGPHIKCTYEGWIWESPNRPFYCQENCKPPVGNIMGVAHAKSMSGSYRVNERVNMECDHDYTQKGDTEIKCTEQYNADGTPASPTWVWTNPGNEMKCHEKCHDPNLIGNIKLRHSRYDIGEVFILECDDGYSPARTPHNNRVQCSQGKQWSWLPSEDPHLSCHANCRETPNVAHAIKQGTTTSFPIGHQLAMTCARGYEARGNRNLKCSTSASGWMWIDNTSRFSCEKTKHIVVPTSGRGFCRRPAGGGQEVFFYKETPLAKLTGESFDEFSEGTTLRCVCSSPGEMFVEGYARKDSNRDVRCLADGKWEECNCKMIPRQVRGIPRIRIRNLGYEVLPGGGMSISTNADRIILDCEYVIGRGDNSNSIPWKRPRPYGYQFQLISAGEEGIDYSMDGLDIMNHTLRIQRRHGNVRPDGTYTCNKKVIVYYSSWQYTEQFYRHSIELVTQDPYRDVCCPSLAAIADGSMGFEKGGLCADGSRYRAGTELKFQCDADFSIEGDEYTHCLNDGTWSHPRPTCRQEVCKDLPFVMNGRFHRRNRGLNDEETVEMRCMPGYTELNGSNIWKCVRGRWTQAADEVPLRCEKEFCQSLPFVPDQHCTALHKGETITKRERLFTGEELTIYHLAGSAVVQNCAGNASTWKCQGRKWESVNPCRGYPEGISKDRVEISPNDTFATDGGDLVVPGSPLYINSGQGQWVCDRNGQWSQTKFCRELPSSLQASCTSLENGTTLTIRDSWMAGSDTFITYYTAASMLSSNCSGADQKWLCDIGQWQRWTNCDELPAQLTLSGTRLKLISSEATDVTSWMDGQTIKVECSTGFRLKAGTDDSWRCEQGQWKQNRSDLDVPECAHDPDYIESSVFSRDGGGNQSAWCDPGADIPNGSVVPEDYGNYDDDGKTVIEVECDNGARVNITCTSGIYDPDLSQACV